MDHTTQPSTFKVKKGLRYISRKNYGKVIHAAMGIVKQRTRPGTQSLAWRSMRYCRTGWRARLVCQKSLIGARGV